MDQQFLFFILFGTLVTIVLGDSSVLGLYKINEESGRLLANSEGPLGLGYLGYSETSPAAGAPTWDHYEEGGGVHFTSHSQVISLPMFSPDLNSFTISAWIKIPDQSFEKDLVIFRITSEDDSRIKLILSMRKEWRLRITYGSTSFMSTSSRSISTYSWQLVGITVEQTSTSTVSLKAFVGKSDTIDPSSAVTGNAALVPLSPDDKFLVGKSTPDFIGFTGNIAYIRVSSPPTDTSFFGCKTDCVSCPAGSISPQKCPAKGGVPPEPTIVVSSGSNITVELSSSDGPSGGTIAGIVIGVLLVIAAIILTVLVIKHQRAKKKAAATAARIMNNPSLREVQA